VDEAHFPEAGDHFSHNRENMRVFTAQESKNFKHIKQNITNEITSIMKRYGINAD
jgi:hypothetical protein